MSHRLYTQGGEDGRAFKFDWVDLIVVVTTTATALSAAITRGLDMADDVARGYANWRRDQMDWQGDLLKDIEAL